MTLSNKCRYAERRNAECLQYLNVVPSVIMLNVVMLSVVACKCRKSNNVKLLKSNLEARINKKIKTIGTKIIINSNLLEGPGPNVIRLLRSQFTIVRNRLECWLRQAYSA
jgi:hypothetical protein